MSEPNKVIKLRPESAPSDDGRMIVTLNVLQLREIIQQEILKAQPTPEKLLYTTDEAAEMLSLKASWIGAGVRNGTIACTRKGHYILFTQEQIKKIAETSTDA